MTITGSTSRRTISSPAISEYASWGYYDQGTNNYVDGYQSPPVNWDINTERKRSFFKLVGEITGAGAKSNSRSAP